MGVMNCGASPVSQKLAAVSFQSTLPEWVDPRPVMQAVRTQAPATAGSAPSSFPARIIEGVAVALVVAFIIKRI